MSETRRGVFQGREEPGSAEAGTMSRAGMVARRRVSSGLLAVLARFELHGQDVLHALEQHRLDGAASRPAHRC